MKNKTMLSTKEVAEYLNINEKQVYKLIKAKSIPATRVTGKWTFPRTLIDEWIIESAKRHTGREHSSEALHNHIVIMGSNDFSIELLSHMLSSMAPEFSLSLSNVGSIEGLIALGRKSCHAATCHLLDPETGVYNLPYLSRYLPDLETTVINLVYRDVGLILHPDNPHHITGLEDLARPEITIINRQEGSGTRIFLDSELKKLQVDPAGITGYEREVNTHTETALAVLGGSADVGLGILPAAKLYSLGFVHLTRERYDIVIPSELVSLSSVQALLGVVRSQEFKTRIQQMGGYDTRHTGTEIPQA